MTEVMSEVRSESAPGPSIMGSEDEVEQSNGRPCVAVRRSKRPSGVTSSIVPARDTIPPLGGARASSYRN
jgi:hypothetical protein